MENGSPCRREQVNKFVIVPKSKSQDEIIISQTWYLYFSWFILAINASRKRYFLNLQVSIDALVLTGKPWMDSRHVDSV